MNARNARLIRLGILAARDAEYRQYTHLAKPLVRAAARREIAAQQAKHLRRFYA